MPSFTHTLAVYIASGMTAAGQLHAQQDAEMSGRFLPIQPDKDECAIGGFGRVPSTQNVAEVVRSEVIAAIGVLTRGRGAPSSGSACRINGLPTGRQGRLHRSTGAPMQDHELPRSTVWRDAG